LPTVNRSDAAHPLRVALADDQALVRAGFRALLGHTPDIEVVGEAGNGLEAVQLARRTSPDVFLMDIRMPDLDGIEATRIICTDPALAGVLVVVLTTFQLDEYVFSALRADASGFLIKDIEPDDLRGAVRAVAAGDALLSPGATRALIEAFTAGPPRPAAATALLPTLTDRERQVTQLAAQGLDNTAIATRLVISPATAKTHVTHAMTKIGARDRAQLVVFAYQSGLTRPPGP
jgi:DNA-binding NarL/FixJ family response regulator